MQPTTVLFLTADPMRVQPLQLGEECRLIEDRIRAAKYRDRIRFRSRWAARPDDLLQALNEDAPAILHFSGHGRGTQGLCFQSEDGSVLHVSAESLEQVICAAGAGVAVVILSACFSEVQARALVAHIPCVIGMSGAIEDERAIRYAGAFYRALAFGRSVANAHEQGLAALALHPASGRARDSQSGDAQPADAAPGAVVPKLLTRLGIDAECIHIVDVMTARRRCEIHIKATLGEFNADVIARVTEVLREVTGDLTLEILEVNAGSVRLTVSLSSDAAATLVRMRRDGELDEICGFEVTDLFEPRETEEEEVVVEKVEQPRPAPVSDGLVIPIDGRSAASGRGGPGGHDRASRSIAEARAAAPRSRRGARPAVIAAALPILAAAGWLIYQRAAPRSEPFTSDPVAVSDRPSAFEALAPRRSLEARVTVPGPDRYRPYDTLRSSEPARAEAISHARLGELERRGDLHTYGVALLLAGYSEEAARSLARAPRSPDVDVDRAAALLAAGSHGELVQALELLDGVLATHPRHGAAAWNRALVLARLELPLGAAKSFAEVAALGEPGWSDDARVRAAKLRAASAAAEKSWREAWAAGSRLIATGTPLPAGTARAHPGVIRLFFYDAVRAAPSRARVLALRPLAVELDGIYGGGALAALVDRVSGADFAVRAPLAATYRSIAIDDAKVEGEARARFLAALHRAGGNAADILLGALVQLREAQRNLGELRALADATRDPWFVALAAHEEAKRDFAAGDYLRAEARLVTALAAARAARISYRTTLLALELANVRGRIHHLPEARLAAQEALDRARGGAEWESERQALESLAEILRLGHEIPLARALIGELLERELVEREGERASGATPRESECTRLRYAHLALASLHMMKQEHDSARGELARVPSCDEPPLLQSVLILDDLQRLGGAPGETARLRSSLDAMRAAGDLTPGQRVWADEVEGRFVLATDRARGEALLREVIAKVDVIGSDEQAARKARADAYSSLILESGRRDEPGRALALMAEEIGGAEPERCAVGVAAGDRLLVVARDASGKLWRRDAPAPPLPVPDTVQLVPDDLRLALADCPVVAVFARPPVQGTPRLLPPSIAWSYHLRGAPPSGETIAPSSLIVSDVVQPPDLARLAPWSQADAPGGPPRIELSGSRATPAVVLEAAARATEIELDVHGIVDLNVSDASYLVLSPDADGKYALTAAEIAATRLHGAPLVILAACHAATVAPYLYEPWGLPLAFIRAGARAVLATPGVVEDAQAGAFFGAVRARVRAGQPPAAALRDERMAWIRNSPESWVRDVMVFEPERRLP